MVYVLKAANGVDVLAGLKSLAIIQTPLGCEVKRVIAVLVADGADKAKLIKGVLCGIQAAKDYRLLIAANHAQ